MDYDDDPFGLKEELIELPDGKPANLPEQTEVCTTLLGLDLFKKSYGHTSLTATFLSNNVTD